jgi:hypothetical protein
MDSQWIKWIIDGSNDTLAGQPTIPAFIETAPGEFQPINECTAAQIATAAGAKLMEARELMQEAARMFDLADHTA